MNIDELQELYDDGFGRITSTDELTISSSEVNLYPNPSTGKLFVESAHQFSSYSITDLRGATLITSHTSDINEIDIALDNGIYFIELHTPDGHNYKEKIIVQR